MLLKELQTDLKKKCFSLKEVQPIEKFIVLIIVDKNCVSWPNYKTINTSIFIECSLWKRFLGCWKLFCYKLSLYHNDKRTLNCWKHKIFWLIEHIKLLLCNMTKHANIFLEWNISRRYLLSYSNIYFVSQRMILSNAFTLNALECHCL